MNESISLPDPSPVPPIEAIIGHWFACGDVHIVFDEGDGQQFFLIKEIMVRSYGPLLDPGQTWARKDGPASLNGTAREQGILRAYHEAGHAVACIDEGIKVEYVTIVPHTNWNGEKILGYCQYDYRLPAALNQDCSELAEKAAKADLGGPAADSMYRTQMGLEMPEGVKHAWRNDRSKARRHLVNNVVDLDEEIDRLFDVVVARFEEAWAWNSIREIAERLCDEGAISGQTVNEIVEQAKAGQFDST